MRLISNVTLHQYLLQHTFDMLTHKNKYYNKGKQIYLNHSRNLSLVRHWSPSISIDSSVFTECTHSCAIKNCDTSLSYCIPSFSVSIPMSIQKHSEFLFSMVLYVKATVDRTSPAENNKCKGQIHILNPINTQHPRVALLNFTAFLKNSINLTIIKNYIKNAFARNNMLLTPIHRF